MVPENNEIANAQSTIQPGHNIDLQTFIDKDTEKVPQTVIIATKIEPEEIVYTITDGDCSTWKEGSGIVLPFRIVRNVEDDTISSHFEKLLIDGKEMNPDYYNLKEGSLIIELKPELLNKISIDKHTISAVFDDGQVDGVFYKSVESKGKGFVPPATGVE